MCIYTYIYIWTIDPQVIHLSPRIMRSQNWWFGEPRSLLYRVKPLYRRGHVETTLCFIGDTLDTSLTSHVFNMAWHRRNTTAFNQIWSTLYAMNIQDICWIFVVVTVPPPILRWHLWCSKRCGLIRVRWHVQSQIWRYLPGLSICLLHIYKDKMMHHNDHQKTYPRN